MRKVRFLRPRKGRCGSALRCSGEAALACPTLGGAGMTCWWEGENSPEGSGLSRVFAKPLLELHEHKEISPQRSAASSPRFIIKPFSSIIYLLLTALKWGNVAHFNSCCLMNAFQNLYMAFHTPFASRNVRKERVLVPLGWLSCSSSFPDPGSEGPSGAREPGVPAELVFLLNRILIPFLTNNAVGRSYRQRSRAIHKWWRIGMPLKYQVIRSDSKNT